MEVAESRWFVRENPYQYDTVNDIWVNHNDITGLAHCEPWSRREVIELWKVYEVGPLTIAKLVNITSTTRVYYTYNGVGIFIKIAPKKISQFRR